MDFDHTQTIYNLEAKWKQTLRQHDDAIQAYNGSLQENQHIQHQNDSIKESILNELKQIKQQSYDKIMKINFLHTKFDKILLQLKEKRNFKPEPEVRPTQEQVINLGMTIHNLLKYDTILKKKEKLEQDHQQKCAKIKDEIKKVKLQISLTEMQLNEINAMVKRPPKN